MNRRKAVAVLSFTPLVSAQAQDSSLRKKFVGVWKLVSVELKDKASGEVRYPYGRDPVGRITYDVAGRMSAQLMNPDRRRFGGSPTRGRAAIGEASFDRRSRQRVGRELHPAATAIRRPWLQDPRTSPSR